MKPVSPVLPSSSFKEVVYGAHQPQYAPLPAAPVRYDDGTLSVVTRWKLSVLERLKVLLSGDIWWEQLTFGQPLQAVRPSTDEPFK